MKQKICTGLGLLGGAVAAAFGGWSADLAALVCFMAVDYGSGLVVAGVFHRSKKSDSGALESGAGFQGLCRKGMILLMVLIGARLDQLLGLAFIRSAVCIGFGANELLSILENAGLMGIPSPKALGRAVELLQQSAEETLGQSRK